MHSRKKFLPLTSFMPSLPHPSFPERDHSHVPLLPPNAAAKIGDSSRRRRPSSPTPTAPGWHTGTGRQPARQQPGNYAGLIRHGATPAAAGAGRAGGAAAEPGNYAIGDGDDSSGKNSTVPAKHTEGGRTDGRMARSGGVCLSVCGGFAGSLY